MTILLGLEHNDKVYIGGDSISLNGWAKDITASRKVFSKGRMLFAVAGNPRQAQLIQHYFDVPPDQAEGEDDEAYLVLEVVEPLRRLFKDRGFTEIDNGRELGPSFLIGYRGKLYSVENAYQLCRSARGMYAMGLGDDFAIAALMALFSAYEGGSRSEADAETCILRALEIAAQLCAGVSAPFYVESV
jgi:ATP-dependent protease HslVU (ClpYQ) peptidase subunit